MKPYPKYKPSGVPWLGDVPEHWSIGPLGANADILNGYPFDSNKFDATDGYKLVRIRDIYSTDTEMKFNGEWVDVAAIDTGDVLIGMDGDFQVAVWKGGVALLNQRVCCLRADEPSYVRYLAYLLPTPLQITNDWTYATTVKHLSSFDVLKYRVPFPSPAEQSAIASYLDTETARIDSLVSEKEKLIGLLFEARVSVVTQLITGEDLPGKPSGNEWMPHLPAGWTLKRLKHLAQVRSGLAKGKNNGSKTTVQLPYLRVANVQDGHLNLKEVLTIEVVPEEAERYFLQPGDVLMNEGGDFDKLGRGAVWSGEVNPCLHQNHVFAVRPYEDDVSDWVAATTLTRNAKFYFMSNAKQSTNLASISQTNVKELPVLLPPPKIRKQRLAQLQAETLKIDGLIAHVKKEIELLKELRSATITAAVLGRIDLREYTKKTKRGEKKGELQPALLQPQAL